MSHSKRAISTVLTTVIILVSSVVLGSGVVLYGTSLFQSGTQSENISVVGTKVWVDTTDPFTPATGIAWGAAAIPGLLRKGAAAALVIPRNAALKSVR